MSSGLKPIVTALREIREAMRVAPRFVWASVVSTDPLRVWVDGDEQPLAASPALASLTPRVGSRVYCVMQNGRATVVGAPDIVANTGAVWWRGSAPATSLGSSPQRLSWGTDSSRGQFTWEPGGSTTLAVGEPGMYTVTFQAAFNNTTGRRDGLLLVNESETYRGIGRAMVGVGQQTIDFTVSRYLEAGDTVAILTQGGGSITMLSGNFGPRFEVSRA